jgi:hypothetical protein
MTSRREVHPEFDIETQDVVCPWIQARGADHRRIAGEVVEERA